MRQVVTGTTGSCRLTPYTALPTFLLSRPCSCLGRSEASSPSLHLATARPTTAPGPSPACRSQVDEWKGGHEALERGWDRH